MGRKIFTDIGNMVEYYHERSTVKKKTVYDGEIFEYYDTIDVYPIERVSSNIFDNKTKISGMKINATINNYDIINELGEDNIRKIISEDYTNYAKGKQSVGGIYSPGAEPLSDETISKNLEELLPEYISTLKSSYHKNGSSTDFSLYVDDDVKIFAKDLKEYNNTTLQYIGIMPVNTDLDKFITNTNINKINNYITNLKSIDSKYFKEGVVTRIEGYIPKFSFEYDLNLMDDLKKHNITDVFDKEKADLKNLANGNAYISTAMHKANIEFNQDGIKAGVATIIGGYGGGDDYDYIFNLPVEYIDLTFDKPYMFLIRDKDTGETWFVGTVYQPLLWENEPENMQE